MGHALQGVDFKAFSTANKKIKVIKAAQNQGWQLA